MQTFLPYESMLESLKCLDYRRLGKQRVETYQLLKSIHYERGISPDIVQVDNLKFDMIPGPEGELIRKPYKGWANHPARTMWLGYEGSLAVYFDLSVSEWLSRGYKNTMLPLSVPGEHSLPPWFGNADFHDSHKSNLLRKQPEHYEQFNWSVPNDLEYIWPTDKEL